MYIFKACQTVTGFITNDHENKVTFLSSERPLEDNVAELVEHAAVRSLSCEVVPGKEGEMYFGDEHRGHVLCHTFFLQDSQARGFHRWFSIVIFMRDKHFLINSWLFFQKHLQQLVSQLQSRAAKVHADEQKACPQRAARLADSAVGSVARPITVLTASPKLLAQVHLWFTWLLSAGAKRLEEFCPSMAFDCDLKETLVDGFVVVEKAPNSAKGRDLTPAHDASTVRCLRQLSGHLGASKTTSLFHALLTGKQLVVRGPQRIVQFLFHLLRFLLPPSKVKSVEFVQTYVGPEEANVIGLPLSAAVPVASSLVERLDIVPLPEPGVADGELELGQLQYLSKSGSTPFPKMPTLLSELMSFLADSELSDQVAYLLVSGLVNKWAHTAEVMKQAKLHSGQDLKPLLQSLGAQEHDHHLLDFWAT